jgi:hypothetical protein
MNITASIFRDRVIPSSEEWFIIYKRERKQWTGVANQGQH